MQVYKTVSLASSQGLGGSSKSSLKGANRPKLAGGPSWRHQARTQQFPRRCQSVALCTASGGKTSGETTKEGARSSIAVSSAEFKQEREKLDQAKDNLKNAISNEDYTEAARLRDEVDRLENEDPIIGRTQRLEECLMAEDYQAAAVLRDELTQLMALLTPKVPCHSDTVTEGVRVKVRSTYVDDRSDPSESYYFFAYQITITNESTRAVQLMSRHWTITDKNGRKETVNGPGVIGEQPVLQPGETFEYTSACPLHTESGTMEGSYNMLVVNEPVTCLVETGFDIQVGCFGLDEFNGEVALITVEENPNYVQNANDAR